MDTEMFWKIEPLPVETGCHVLSVLVGAHSGTPDEYSKLSLALQDGYPDASPLRFILESINQTAEAFHANGVFVKLLLPQKSGFVVQSDFLQRRMVDCHNIAKTVSFLSSNQEILAVPKEVVNSNDFFKIAASAIGGFVSCPLAKESIEYNSALANGELAKRISFPWISQQSNPRKRMVFVGGRKLSALEGYTTAAESLNIAVVVLDEPDHWLADPKWSYIREDFVPFDMTADESLPQRIAEAVRCYPKPVDGIMTIEEHLLTLVSKAAALLGMPTSPPESVGMAQNKYLTRQLDKKVYCTRVSCRSDLDKLLEQEGSKLEYPLIIKPSRGWASEGVFKVGTEQDLLNAVNRLWRDSFTAWHGSEIVIETYVDGPEIDANMVLYDGKVLFFEVNDDFPSPGDSEKASSFENFVEDSNMIPSILPEKEIKILEQSLHQFLLKGGFQTGVFHLEARLRNSTHHFDKVADDGSIDLVQKKKLPDHEMDVFLLEINPRAPGMQEINASQRAYGVSYYSLSVLNALRDRSRIEALCQPFVGGSQYHMQILFISAERGGVYKSGDVCEAALRSNPELRQNVAECMSFLENGQEVPDPKTGSMTWVAFFLVYSRVSREDALHAGQKLKTSVRRHIEECDG